MSESKSMVYLGIGSLGVLGLAGLSLSAGWLDFGTSPDEDGSRRVFAEPRGPEDLTGVTAPVELVQSVLAETLESLIRGELGDLSQPGIEDELVRSLAIRGWGNEAVRRRAALLLATEANKSAPRNQRLAQEFTSVQRRAVEAVAGRLARRLVNNGDLDQAPSVANVEDILVPIPAGFQRVHWKTLGGFMYEPGKLLPGEVSGLNGQPVALVGFMLPIAETRDLRRFLLVESLWGCCFGAVPEMNQVIEVRVAESQSVDYEEAAVVVAGTLEVGEEKEDGVVLSVYRLREAVVQVLPSM